VPSPQSSGSGDHRAALLASYLGWTLDAFDYFLVVMCLTAIGREFHKTDEQIAIATWVTLAFRPVGAFIFGLVADRYGRRLPLMIDLVFYSVVEVLSGLAPSYTAFLVLRALFGIGMGGEWGVGASLALEKAPVRLRGLLRDFYSKAMRWAFCWHRWRITLFFRTTDGGRYSLSAGCRHCWRCLCARV
jgi:SHS family lactate transporter-like MFS transporter